MKTNNSANTLIIMNYMFNIFGMFCVTLLFLKDKIGGYGFTFLMIVLLLNTLNGVTVKRDKNEKPD